MQDQVIEGLPPLLQVIEAVDEMRIDALQRVAGGLGARLNVSRRSARRVIWTALLGGGEDRRRAIASIETELGRRIA